MIEAPNVTPERKGPKVLYIITKTNFGGAQRYVYDLALQAHEEGIDVAVAGGGPGELLERLTGKGIATHRIAAYQRDINLSAEWRALRELGALISKERPNVLHVNSSKGGLALLAGFLHRVPKRVFTVHGWAWNEERPRHQKVLIWLAYYLTLLLATDVIVVSHAARAQARFPVLSRKMHVIWNGVSSFPLLSREEARQKLLPDARKRFWVGTIAELHPIKGLPTLIEAYEHFAPDVSESELVIIGEGQERPRLERQLTIEGVANTSCLLGYVPDASSYLKAFDVFVLGSRSEGLPYVLLEAGMAGIPVVATRVGGIPEIIEDGKTGLLVPYGDREALSQALVFLAKHNNKREELARALHEKILQDFSLEKMAEETFALYR